MSSSIKLVPVISNAPLLRHINECVDAPSDSHFSPVVHESGGRYLGLEAGGPRVWAELFQGGALGAAALD